MYLVRCKKSQNLVFMKKEKYDIEFVLGNASQQSVWRMLTEPTALEEWFADKVLLEDETLYTFVWDEKELNAEMVLKKPMSHVRYSWLTEDNPDFYFEFKILIQDLSGDMALQVTDFAHLPEKEDAIFMWENQIDLMKRKLGI